MPCVKKVSSLKSAEVQMDANFVYWGYINQTKVPSRISRSLSYCEINMPENIYFVIQIHYILGAFHREKLTHFVLNGHSELFFLFLDKVS